MTSLSKWWLAALTVAVLAACGGGGGGGGGGEPPVPPTLQSPPVTGTPTAVLTASSQTAADLVAAARAGASAVDQVEGFSSLPLGVQVSPPSAVTSTETLSCSGGGSYTGSVNALSPDQPSVGDTINLQFANCVEFNISFSGRVDMSITRYVSADDFTGAFSVEGLTMIESGLPRGPLSFKGQVDYSPSGMLFAY